MSPKAADPAVAQALVQAAARLLGTEGRDAVSARRLAREVGASTMAVYTHFGGMDELLAAVRREGFRRFGETIDAPSATDDAVADWMVQGWAYRRFALDEPHLWTVIFGDVGVDQVAVTADDAAAALATFTALRSRIDRCVEAGRWQLDDTTLASEVCWAQVHGLAGIELAGYFADVGRDPLAAVAESQRRMSLGFGDRPEATDDSLRRSRRRARAGGLI